MLINWGLCDSSTHNWRWPSQSERLPHTHTHTHTQGGVCCMLIQAGILQLSIISQMGTFYTVYVTRVNAKCRQDLKYNYSRYSLPMHSILIASLQQKLIPHSVEHVKRPHITPALSLHNFSRSTIKRATYRTELKKYGKIYKVTCSKTLKSYNM